MISTPRRRTGLPRTLLLGAAVLGLGSNAARGDFWGMGIGGFNYVPSPTDFLNQQSLMNAANATRGPVSNNVYAGNPNAFINRVRDNGIVPTFDVTRRAPMNSRASRPVAQAPRPAAEPAPASAPTSAARPPDPLASFFDAAKRLIWPSDAPVAGDLQQRRDIADDGCRMVLDELKAEGRATIATVTESRQKLLDYGQPALRHVRRYSTPRVADVFNVFLLALYDSLADAANPR